MHYKTTEITERAEHLIKLLCVLCVLCGELHYLGLIQFLV